MGYTQDEHCTRLNTTSRHKNKTNRNIKFSVECYSKLKIKTNYFLTSNNRLCGKTSKATQSKFKIRFKNKGC